MTDDELAAEFDALRPYLMRVAYSHLGQISEAEDVVQDAWLRLQRTDATRIEDLRGWLTVTVARLALDVSTSARARRESYVGTWLPEPLVNPTANSVADRVSMDDSISYALLVVLESLTPAERCAFLLHDVFGYEFTEVADVVGRTPQAVRQLAVRARRHVAQRRPRFPATAQAQRRTLAAFLDAVGRGDIGTRVTLLDPDVEFRSDGGGKATAARQVLHGAARVAGTAVAMMGQYQGRVTVEPCEVNGETGLLVYEAGQPTIVHVEFDGDRIWAINVVRNPDKLRRLPASRIVDG